MPSEAIHEPAKALMNLMLTFMSKPTERPGHPKKEVTCLILLNSVEQLPAIYNWPHITVIFPKTFHATREGLGDMAGADSSIPEVEELAQNLYPKLHRIAHGIRRSMGSGETLRTTALVNEAFLKLARGKEWNDQGHFMAAAAMAMRQIVVDQARARLAQRRGSGAQHLSLDQTGVWDTLESATDSEFEVAVGEALEALATLNPRLAQVVECRYFAGFSVADTAFALGVTERTVHRDWLKARGWLYQQLEADVIPPSNRDCGEP